MGGALGELQTLLAAELGSIKEVLAQLEAAMNSADGEMLRLIRELDGQVRGAMAGLEKTTTDQNEMTGKVIMKMARQITEMQVKLRELTELAVRAHHAAASGPSQAQVAAMMAAQQAQQAQAQQAQQLSSNLAALQQLSAQRSEPESVPFAARMLAQQGGGGGGSHGGAEAPSSPMRGGGSGGARTSTSGAAAAILARVNADGGRNVGASPARASLAADPPSSGSVPRMPRLSDNTGNRR